MNIKKLCSSLGYSRQAYYKSQKPKRIINDQELLSCIFSRRKELPMEGQKKLYTYLVKVAGFTVTREHLQDILEANMLIIHRKRRYRVLTNSEHDRSVAENYLSKTTPGHVFEALASDITFLKTKQKEYYLTAIMDLYSRIILAYSLSDNLNSESLKRAFLLIARTYKDKLQGCLFHSDRGKQFCSTGFKELAGSYGMVLSNSRKGNPYDNACMERVFATLKNEYMLKITFPDEQTLINAVRDAIYSYNNQRLHWSLGLMTPREFFLSDLKSY